MVDGIGTVATIAAQQAAPASRVLAKQAEAPERKVDPPVTVQGGSVEPPSIQPGQLQLDIDQSTGRVVGRIIDKESGVMIKQIPSEEALRLIAASQKLLGAFIDRKL
jgi:flagellar protein FlaG